MPLGAARFGLLGGVADLGKLELIETQSMAGASIVDFTNLGSYNVHFMTMNNFVPSTSSNEAPECRLSNNGGSSFISSGYQYAFQYGGSTGTFGEGRGTSATTITGFPYINDEGNSGFYIYFYNLLDSSKYSYSTHHSMDYRGDNVYSGQSFAIFGSNVLTTAETHNAIRFFSSNNVTSADFSLYGIAES
jgi:hypothetical protein